MQVSILYAFVAGIISFLSPCVLPLVPGYVSMLSGSRRRATTGGPAGAQQLVRFVAGVCFWIFGGVYQFWGFGQRGGPVSAAAQSA